MNLARLGAFLYVVASSITQGLSSNNTIDRSTTQNSSIDRIYGGTPVDAVKYPYIAQLNINKEGSSFLCGGTLITSQFVVTAAHCVDTFDTGMTISATLGSVVKTVSSYTIHPYYNAATHDNDVAVLKLQTTVTIKGIPLAKADGSDNKVGAAANVWGWGVTKNGQPSTILEEVPVKIISNNDCSPSYAGDSVITKGMMCAWGGKGKDACQGDSGGPLFSNNVLVGVVSFGLGCGEVPGVYTRVSYVRDFIMLVINGVSSRIQNLIKISMNFTSIARVTVCLYAVGVVAVLGIPSSNTSDLPTTTQNNSVERIYGGTPVDATQYPYIVQLEIMIDDEPSLCGGTLIVPQFVVTAAHCVESDKMTSISAMMGSEVRAVKSYTIHPNYNTVTLENDVAVLKLSEAVDIEGVRLAKADGSDNKVGATAVALGWGVTEDGEPSMSLEKVSLKIISNTKCSPPYEGISVITKGMMCAWGGEGKDTCQGDSGGPLFSNNALVGIVSFGIGCGEVPGVYTRVSYVRDFILSVIHSSSSRSFKEIATKALNAREPATEEKKVETATTVKTGDSAIQTEGLTGGAVAAIALALLVAVAQGLPLIRASDLSATTQNSSIDRIYGGSTVDAVKYPYIAQLNINKEGGSFLCGGTLITSQFVVTAAHCVDTFDTGMTISATLGSVVKTVSSYTIHPYYNAATHDNDVAVLKLQTTVDIDVVRLAKADGSDNKVGVTAVAYGWGNTEDGETSMSLEKVSLKIISNTKCSPPYEGISVITKGMMCAWGGEGKDTCQGDSGGPLFSNNALVGIVSFGYQKCGEAPGVYTRVSYVRDFIISVVNDDNSRSFTKIATKVLNARGPTTKAAKAETATTADADNSTIQVGGLTVGAVAAIALALCAVVSLAGFTIYKLHQRRTNDVAEVLSDVYYKQPMTPATPSANM
ncbi:Transmembrane protease serine 9 [Phytophthora citrophthora]|uniref:Transmembrane protease serine 9 n=1 Tax=Phytophthora citrophthora TaxID=4793 RepID=A0AAD9GPX4_9STRA|nr:Transmembrane protease serine 9 [Phytophthora citrophthora]